MGNCFKIKKDELLLHDHMLNNIRSPSPSPLSSPSMYDGYESPKSNSTLVFEREEFERGALECSLYQRTDNSVENSRNGEEGSGGDGEKEWSKGEGIRECYCHQCVLLCNKCENLPDDCICIKKNIYDVNSYNGF